jgi:hypothetical protein
MHREYVDEVYATELLQRQDALQAEAQQLIAVLDLFTLLSRAGMPEQIGSSVAGLMVWRDLDFNVLCSHLTLDRLFETVRPLLIDPCVTRFHYTNETGRAAPAELHGDERYYCVIYYEREAGNEWKIDLSFWLSDAPRSQLPYLEYLSCQLTDETRLAILWIKDAWRHLPTYPYQVSGIDVYDAVLEHGVRTPAQFEAYLTERGMPTR